MKKTNKHKNPYKISTICLALLSITLSALLIFYPQNTTNEEIKKAEAFDTLANSFITSSFFVENEQVPSYMGTGTSEDNDLYISFKLTKYQDHLNTAERNYRIYFQCKNKNPLCNTAGWADEWTDIVNN